MEQEDKIIKHSHYSEQKGHNLRGQANRTKEFVERWSAHLPFIPHVPPPDSVKNHNSRRAMRRIPRS